jgi:hypothetical protein
VLTDSKRLTFAADETRELFSMHAVELINKKAQQLAARDFRKYDSNWFIPYFADQPVHWDSQLIHMIRSQLQLTRRETARPLLPSSELLLYRSAFRRLPQPPGEQIRDSQLGQRPLPREHSSANHSLLTSSRRMRYLLTQWVLYGTEQLRQNAKQLPVTSQRSYGARSEAAERLLPSPMYKGFFGL